MIILVFDDIGKKISTLSKFHFLLIFPFFLLILTRLLLTNAIKSNFEGGLGV